MFRARRGSDGATQDFYALPSGDHWTAPDATVTGERIEDWLNGSAAYCTTWYDQSGAGKHATQVAAGAQPVVDWAGGAMDLTANGGASYFRLPDGTVPQNVAYTVTVRHGVINNAMGGWLGGGSASTNRGNNFRRDPPGYVNYWYNNDFSDGVYSPGNVITFKYDGVSTVFLYTNSNFTASKVKSSGWAGNAWNEYLGRTINPNEALNGKLYYVYIFKSNLTDANRKMIEAGTYGKLP